VLLGRIELPTSALPRMRSTTELQQHTISAAPGAWSRRARRRYWPWGRGLSTGTWPKTARGLLARRLHLLTGHGREAPMAANGEMTREERLAAKLRENLRRRKAQARALGGEPDSDSGPSLPKPPPTR
jgi:hypothetical protein